MFSTEEEDTGFMEQTCIWEKYIVSKKSQADSCLKNVTDETGCDWGRNRRGWQKPDHVSGGVGRFHTENWNGDIYVLVRSDLFMVGFLQSESHSCHMSALNHKCLFNLE